MLKKILLAVIGLVAALLLYAATRPADFRVQRSATIAAPPDRVYANVADLRRWDTWSPWEKKDPDMQRSYGAATAGPGATYAWSGDSTVGTGSLRIAEAAPPSRLELSLEFTEPFEARNTVEFAFEPVAAGTRVTWTMSGTNDFLAKLIGVFMDVDGMVGKDFEDGLANLKTVAEAEP